MIGYIETKEEPFDISEYCGYEDNKVLKEMGLEVIFGWTDDIEEEEEEVYFLGIDLDNNCEDNGQIRLAKINKANQEIIKHFPKKQQNQNFYSGVQNG